MFKNLILLLSGLISLQLIAQLVSLKFISWIAFNSVDCAVQLLNTRGENLLIGITIAILRKPFHELKFVLSLQLVDYRVEFSKWWVTEFKTIKFPSAGTVFDYFIDSETKKFVPWTEKVPKFELDSEIPLQVGCFGLTYVLRPLIVSRRDTL